MGQILTCMKATPEFGNNSDFYFRTMKAVTALTFFSWMQVGLGITTLLTYVPVSIAAMHQANALVTLSSAIWLSHELKNLKFDQKLMKALRHVPK